MKRSYLLGLLATLTMGLASCSSDAPDPGNGVAQKDEVRFMRIAISTPSGSRAEEKFEDGTGNENTVHNIKFKFFNAAGEYLTYSDVSDYTFVKADQNTGWPNVEKVKEAVVQINLKEGDPYPSYVVAFCNPVAWNENSVKEINDYRTYKGGRIITNNGTFHFGMSSSAYYGDNAVEGTSNVKITGTPIKGTQIFAHRESALAATGDNVVEMYVERYAAKVKFTIDDNACKPFTIDGFQLKFEPSHWFVNAQAPDFYIIKNFVVEGTDPNAAIPTFDQLNLSTNLGYFNWNSKDNHRSYWGSSTTYFETKFPRVADDVLYGASIDSETGLFKDTPYMTQYFSYDMVTQNEWTYNRVSLGQALTGDKKSSQAYVMENTMGHSALNSINPKAAAPSVVIVGKYTISKDGNEIDLSERTLYRYNEEIYFDEAVEGVKASSLLDRMLDNQNLFYYRDNDGTFQKVVANSPQDIKDNFEIAHPKREVFGNSFIREWGVTLQVKDTYDPSTKPLFYTPIGATSIAQLQATQINTVNSALWDNVGLANAYTKGMGFYSIPIRHLGWYETTHKDREGNEVNPETANASELANLPDDFENAKIGEYGLVRNHVYTLGVSEISSIGCGILDPKHPIVPEVEKNAYFIKYSLRILSWRIVPKQTGIKL